MDTRDTLQRSMVTQSLTKHLTLVNFGSKPDCHLRADFDIKDPECETA